MKENERNGSDSEMKMRCEFYYIHCMLNLGQGFCECVSDFFWLM